MRSEAGKNSLIYRTEPENRICSEETVNSQESAKSVREREGGSMVERICERGGY